MKEIFQQYGNMILLIGGCIGIIRVIFDLSAKGGLLYLLIVDFMSGSC